VILLSLTCGNFLFLYVLLNNFLHFLHTSVLMFIFASQEESMDTVSQKNSQIAMAIRVSSKNTLHVNLITS